MSWTLWPGVPALAKGGRVAVSSSRTRHGRGTNTGKDADDLALFSPGKGHINALFECGGAQPVLANAVPV